MAVNPACARLGRDHNEHKYSFRESYIQHSGRERLSVLARAASAHRCTPAHRNGRMRPSWPAMEPSASLGLAKEES